MAEMKTATKPKVVEGEVVPKLTVIRNGDSIVIPNTITLDMAIKILTSQRNQEEQIIEVSRKFDGTPWADAALALQTAMAQAFIWVDAESTHHWLFGTEPPQVVKVKSGPNGESINIPIGKFALEAAEKAEVQIQTDGIACYFSVKCKRKYEFRINEMLRDAEMIMRNQSIYRTKELTFDRTTIKTFFGAVEVDDLGFMDVGGEKSLILPDTVERDVRANIWTLLLKADECAKMGVPAKRAALLHGPYGTGKTLIAHQTAHITKSTGHTFVYLSNAEHLSRAYEFAKSMKPCVLFVEDIDRNVEDQEYVQELSLVLDGVNTKDSGVVLIATTNHVEKIPPILLRAGRIDCSIEVPAPDAKTVERLVRHYAPTMTGDLSEACELLKGQIAAMVREACERAKLFALADGRMTLTSQDLVDAASSMKRQMALMDAATSKPKELTASEQLGKSLEKIVDQVVASHV